MIDNDDKEEDCGLSRCAKVLESGLDFSWQWRLRTVGTVRALKGKNVEGRQVILTIWG